jgi:hypothetical protein
VTGAVAWPERDLGHLPPGRIFGGIEGYLSRVGVMSADVTALIANDAAKLPAGSAVIVDDFHYAAAAVAGEMTDLVKCWPAGTAHRCY